MLDYARIHCIGVARSYSALILHTLWVPGCPFPLSKSYWLLCIIWNQINKHVHFPPAVQITSCRNVPYAVYRFKKYQLNHKYKANWILKNSNNETGINLVGILARWRKINFLSHTCMHHDCAIKSTQCKTSICVTDMMHSDGGDYEWDMNKYKKTNCSCT